MVAKPSRRAPVRRTTAAKPKRRQSSFHPIRDIQHPERTVKRVGKAVIKNQINVAKSDVKLGKKAANKAVISPAKKAIGYAKKVKKNMDSAYPGPSDRWARMNGWKKDQRGKWRDPKDLHKGIYIHPPGHKYRQADIALVRTLGKEDTPSKDRSRRSRSRTSAKRSRH